MRSFWNFSRLNLAVIALFLMPIIGVIGFRHIEDFSYLESFYMTIITLSTVGFGEVKALSDNGRLFTAFLIVTSFGIFAYSIHSLTSYIFTGELKSYFKNRRVKKFIGEMKDHVIVCGYGRNGKRAVEEFKAHKVKFVVIEQNEKLVGENEDTSNSVFIHGDSTEDDILEKAKIREARALISALPVDADNLLTVLTAREMNKELLIISRASQDNSYNKLKMAGANNVIMPDKIGGAHMATLVLKPDVVEFFDQIIMKDPETPYLKEVLCSKLSEDNHGHSIGELKESKKYDVTIIGLKNQDGSYTINPSNDVILEPDSKLFVLGTPEQIEAL